MANPSTVMKLYNPCLHQLEQFLKSKGLSYYGGNFYTESISTSQVAVKLTAPLYLKDWRYRPDSKCKIDIVVNVEETVVLSDPCICIKSTVHLDYFDLKDDEAIASDAIHFDFENPPSIRHPICHAQGKNDLIEPRPENFARQVNNDAIRRRNQCIRIPTALLNFAGIMSMLSADHMTTDQYADFLQAVAPSLAKLPLHGPHDCLERILAAGQISGANWYSN